MSGVKCSGTELSLAHCRHDEDVACPQGGVQYGAGVACSESETCWVLSPSLPTSPPLGSTREPESPPVPLLGSRASATGPTQADRRTNSCRARGGMERPTRWQEALG